MAVITEIAETFLRSQFAARRDQNKPLIVAIQGSQGSGKSYLSAQLEEVLSNGSPPLRAVVLSIDDLYLPHEGLVRLAESYPHNLLLQGRGQPGTHDVALGLSVLASLSSGNSEVSLPHFDKSKYNGEGDRIPADNSPVVHQPPPVDIIILEGWCVGFCSISHEEIEERWGIWEEERAKLQILDAQCSKADILEINGKLREYESLWDACHAFVQLGLPSPPDEFTSRYHVIYKWRLEQETSMKALNGGKGMSDEAVKRFVDRYIPGYVFFWKSHLDTGSSRPRPSLLLKITETRQLEEACQK